MSSLEFMTGTLADICTVITDGSHFSPTPQEEGFPIVNAKDIPDGRVVLDTCTRISKSDYDLLKIQNCAPVPGDVLLSKDGTIGRVVHYKNDLGVVLLSSVAILRPDQATIAPAFLAQVLRSHVFDQQLFRLQSGSALKRLVLGDIRKIQVPLPKLNVQAEIAKVLSTADEAIEQTEALIAKYQQIKAGLMHDLFTRGVTPDGNLRPTRAETPHLYKESSLGWIPKEWEIATVGSCINGVDAGKSPDCPDTPASGDQWGVLKVGAVDPEGLRESENKMVTDDRLKNSAFLICPNDLLLSRANTVELVGLVCHVTGKPNNLMLSDKTLRLRPNTSSVTTRFLFYALQTSQSRRQIEMLATGTSGSMKNISQGGVKSVQLARPQPNEQVLIADRIDALVDVVTSLKSNAGKLLQIKDGLMHDLLTGRVRVKVPEVAQASAR